MRGATFRPSVSKGISITDSDGLTLPGLTIYSKPKIVSKDQANPGFGSSLILNFGELILPYQLLSPSFEPEKISTSKGSWEMVRIVF